CHRTKPELLLLFRGLNAGLLGAGNLGGSSSRGAFGEFFLRIEAAATVLGAAAAGCIVVPIVQVVIVGKFLAGSDVSQSNNPYPAVDFVCLAVWVATVVDESGNAVAIDHVLTVGKPEEVGFGTITGARVYFLDGKAWSGVFHDVGSLVERSD